MQLEACPPIEYVKRKNQRNLRIRVKSDAVVVSAPYFCSQREMTAFVYERREWILETVGKLREKTSKTTNLLKSRENEILLRGEWLPLVIRPTRPGSKTWLLKERENRVDVYPPESFPAPKTLFETATVPNDIKNAFAKKLAQEELPLHFEELSGRLPFRWSRLFIRSQKTKWGTCSSKGNISLNWRLIKCPATIRDYIIIHELCHTVHLNHSPAFWNLVRQYYPDIEKAHKWLKTEGQFAFL